MLTLARLWAFALLIAAVFAAADISPANELIGRSPLISGGPSQGSTCKAYKLAIFAKAKGQRFQRPKWLDIKNGDGQITEKFQDGDKFEIKNGQVYYGGCPIVLNFCLSGYAIFQVGSAGKQSEDITFTIGNRGALKIGGGRFNGKFGSVCVSKDNTVFVEENDCTTPFDCFDIWIVPVCVDDCKPHEPPKDIPCPKDDPKDDHHHHHHNPTPTGPHQPDPSSDCGDDKDPHHGHHGGHHGGPKPKDKEPKDKEPKDKEPKDKEPKDKQPKDKKPKDRTPKF